MNRELQDYYENRFKMMATIGWTELIEDVETMLKSTDTLGGVKNEQELYFKKGEISILHWLKTLKETSHLVYENLQKEEDNGS